jgi:glycosyltransferase involved in cell wall biosynthesis
MSMVSIVMTTYNGGKYVAKQIESILVSSFKDIELYIYDDGSKDDTISVLKKYEKLYPDKIHVYKNEENLGVTINFLNAVCRTTTDYVMLCDQDDFWKSDKIAVTLKRMRSMEAQFGKDTPMAVFTDAQVVDRNLNLLKDSFFKAGHLNPKKRDLPHLLMENKLIGCTVILNSALKKILQGHKLPRHARFHDWWIALIAAAFGRIGYLDQGTLLYRQHGENVVGNTTFFLYIKNRVCSFKKQRETVRLLERQAQEFLTLYGDMLEPDKKVIIDRFASLSNKNYVNRRWQILRYGYLKTGVIRNIGLMIIV